MTDGKQRHGCLTAFLLVAIILNALAAASKLLWGGILQQSFPDAPGWAFSVLGVLAVFNIVCLVALLYWKKWGFYGCVVTGLLGFAVNLVIGLPVVQSVAGLFGIAILYGVLQIGRANKGWPQLL